MIVDRTKDDYYYDNPSWRRWGIVPLVLGVLLTLFGLIIQILEIVRIYNGLYNNGILAQNLIQPGVLENLVGPGVSPPSSGQFLAAEQWMFWPWTYPGSLFGLLIMVAGITGIVSAYRKTYSTLYAFFALSLFSLLLSIFLIIYYSILMRFYQTLRTTQGLRVLGINNIGAQSGTISNGTAGTNLAFSVLTLITATFACFLAGNAGRIARDLKRPYVPVGAYPRY